MNKIIVSSSALCRILQEFVLQPTNLDEDYVTVKCENKKLHIGSLERTLDVESKSEWQAEIHNRSINGLISFAKSISDQPLVMTFDNGFFIEIFNVLI